MKQRLPESERAYLSSLTSSSLIRDRARDLCAHGWSLAAVADAFSPPKTRSSIRAWALSTVPPVPHNHPPIPASPLSSSSSLITAGEKSDFAADTRKTIKRRRVYDPANPKISSTQKKKISSLAPLARRYRARTSPNGTYARANQELTELCKDLYRTGASVRELSKAAGVTYRAMARRIGK